MENKIKILPGIPDDDNREYLPEAIKGSDIVVNENGNNSQPYPKNLQEFHGIMGNDTEDEWYEYVPECYDPSRKTPLVLAMHGGLMTGWGQAVYTSWTMVADRDNIIVVFPNAHTRRLWTMEATEVERRVDEQMPDDIKQNLSDNEHNPDIKMVFALLEYLKEKYNIDEERIFMQGMSNGNMFTSQFARYFGNLLTAASGAGGGTPNPRLLYADGKIKNEAGPVGMWTSIPETNGCPPWCEFDDQTIYKYTRVYWNEVNGCRQDPEISIIGEDAFAFYKGDQADTVFFEIKNRDHGQTLDEAAIVWDYYFSGLRRKADGTIVDKGSRIPRTGDAFAIAVAEGCRTAWVNNQRAEMKTPAVKWQKLKYHGLNGGQKVRGEYLCVPVSLIAQAFGAEYKYEADGAIAYLYLEDKRVLQFARGSIGCVIDNEIRCMYCEALHRDGELCISLEWFARFIMNMCASKCGDVLYVTDHHAELGVNMADLIRNLLRGVKEQIVID
ncbi:MAG: hypothetical protein KH304_05345 [Clostridium sp.]|nr:hypothetical protein [Clostridium sp.]